MPRPIILDCDPGHDDAVALLLAFASPELDLLGVTVTHGNVALTHTLQNALKVRTLAGVNVPVFAGADRPLVREAHHAAHIHGESGLGDVPMPDPVGRAEPRRAAEFLIESALARPGELTVVAVGPLTNVALALRLESRFASALKGIVLMGGSTDQGNVTPAAEFNFYADPHAARVVFEAGVPLTMFGLNATRQVRVTPERAEELDGVGTRAARTSAAFLRDYLTRQLTRGRHAGALHDPCTVAFLLRPDLFGLQDMHVQIETQRGQNFGRSTCDITDVLGHAPNARVAVQADEDGVYALIRERLARLP